MTKIVLLILLSILTSFSFAEEEVEIGEMDEIEELINETQKQPAQNQDEFLKELQRLGHKSLSLSALKDPRVKDVIAKQFDDSYISLMSLENKRKVFNSQFEDSFLKDSLDKFPKVRDIFVDIITDKNSMLGLLSIFQKEERIYFLYVLVGTFVLNLLLKKIIISSYSNFFVRFIQRLVISAFTSILALGCLFYLFKKELTPIVKVVSSHF